MSLPRVLPITDAPKSWKHKAFSLVRRRSPAVAEAEAQKALVAELKLHIVILSGDDELDDRGEEYPLSAFGGVVPNAGDWILSPGSSSGGERSRRDVRQVWEVVRRFHWAMDLGGEFLVLIVRERDARASESSVIGTRRA